MNIVSIIMFVLFPFLHNTIYPASLTSCNSESIIINSQGEDMTVSLFNLNIINEKGWNHTCKMLEEAKEISFEIDASSKIDEPIPVYLFADGKLIQEEIIRNEEGYSVIHNPEYKYQKRLDALDETSLTMATADEQKESEHNRSYGFIYLAVFILLWILLYYQLIYKAKKYKQEINRKKTSTSK